MKFISIVLTFLILLSSPILAFADDNSDSDSFDNSEEISDDSDELDDFADFYEFDDDQEAYGFDPTYDPWWMLNNDSSSESAYEEALENYKEAIENNLDDSIIEALEQELNETYQALVSYCEENNYEILHSENTGYVIIFDEEQQPIAKIGDPVLVSNGKYFLECEDISLNIGKSAFSIKRNYQSISKKEEIEDSNNGSFGSYWSSNLDSRIILGYSDSLINSIAKISESLESLYDYKSKMEEIEKDTEDDEYIDVYEKINNLINEREKLLCDANQSEKAKNLNKYTCYGKIGAFASKIGTSKIIYVTDNGTPIVFDYNEETKSYKTLDDNLAKKICLTKNEDGYILEYKNIEKRIFDEYGILKSIEKPNSIKITFESIDGRVSNITISNANGGKRELKIKRKDNLITEIKDEKRSVSYKYENGLLVSFTDNEKDTKRYEYEDNELTKIYKPDGSFVKVNYEDVNNEKRVTSTVNENGKVEKFSYDIENSKTTYIDYDGFISEIVYDKNGNTTYQKYPNEITYSYQYDRNKISKMQFANENIDFSYDADGNVIEKKFSDGTFEKFSYSNGKLISKIDRDNVLTNFEYDNNNNITGYFIAGKRISTLYYENGNLISSIDCFGNEKRYEYNKFGEMEKKVIYKKNAKIPSSIEMWEYDSIGRLKKYTDNRGIAYTYEYAPHSLIITSSDKTQTVYKYTNRKKLESKSFTDLLTNENRTFYYEYDKTGLLTKKYISGTDSYKKQVAKTLLESYSYTNSGRLSKKIIWNMSNDDNNEITYSYKNSELSQIEYKNENEKRWTKFNRSNLINGFSVKQIESIGNDLTSIYDSSSNLLSKIDSNQNEYVSNFYSSAGRLLKARNENGLYDFEYDNSGRIIGYREENGTINDFNTIEYYDDGKVKSKINILKNKTSYSYDEFGNLNEIKSNRGTILFKYDSLKNLLSKTILSNENKLVFEEKFIYEDNYRTVKHYENEILKETLKLDAFKNIISKIDALNNKTSYKYDLLNRCICETNAYGDSTYYEYNALSKIQKITKPDNSFLLYHYDVFGNCIRIEDSFGDVYRASYDNNGRIISKDKRPFSSTEYYEYDNANRLLSVKKNNIVLEKYTYSTDNKTIIRTDSKNNKIIFNTDGFGRILSKTNRLGDCESYTYQKDGEVASYTDYFGKTCSYTYSPSKLSKTKTISNEQETHFEYDTLNRIVYTKNNDSELSYTYGKNGKIESIYDSTFGTRINYTYDELGNITNISSTGGIERSTSYQYGKLGEVTKVIDSLKNSSSYSITEVDFVYDKCGRETLRKYKTGESIHSVYDKAGRLILRVGYDSKLSVIFVYGAVFDENGNTSLTLDTNLNVTRYTYDSNGRLQTVSYPYLTQMKNYFENLMEECGIQFLSNDINVSRLAIHNEEYQSLQLLCKKIGNGTFSISPNQSVLVESFEYDTEGNVTKRKTPLGSINFIYDNENRLISYGASENTQTNKCELKYDKNGNLSQKITANCLSKFEYNFDNRMIRSIVSNTSDNSSIYDTSYKNDSFGRRISTNDAFTVYSDLDLKVLYSMNSNEKTVSENTYSKTDSIRTKNSSDIQTQNGRYIFISDEENENKTKNTKIYSDVSIPLYVNESTPISYSSISENYLVEKNVLMTDKMGSVKSKINENGETESFYYDAFGFPSDTENVIPYGFIGKSFDKILKNYDFGYRDYSPKTFRFTSVDPILDGKNWYSYCDGNPVDFADFDGLFKAQNNSNSEYENSFGNTEYNMNDNEWNEVHFGLDNTRGTLGTVFDSSGAKISDGQGCAVTAVAEALSDLFGIDITPAMIASNPNFFDDDDNLKWAVVADTFGATLEASGRGISNTTNFIDSKMNDTENEYAVVTQTHIGDRGESSHFVSVSGSSTTKSDGTVSVPITTTSNNDKGTGYGRGNAGWTIDDNQVNATIQNQNDHAYSFGHGNCSN